MSRFEIATVGPPVLVMWISKDETVRLGVAQAANPRRHKLIQKSMEKGLCEEINGTITDSRADNLRGYTVFRMSARGNILGKDAFLAQSIVAVDDKIYKIMAVTLDRISGRIGGIILLVLLVCVAILLLRKRRAARDPRT